MSNNKTSFLPNDIFDNFEPMDNEKFKTKTLQQLAIDKERLLAELWQRVEIFHKLEPMDKWEELKDGIVILSVCKSCEVQDLFDELGLGKLAANYFVDAETVFKSLDVLQNRSKIKIEYWAVWECFYMQYLKLFFSKKIMQELKYDIGKEINKWSRQEKNGRLPQLFMDKFGNYIEFIKFHEQEPEGSILPLFEGRYIYSFKKIFNHHYNIVFYIMYITLEMDNKKIQGKEFSLFQFKCDFFDLASIFFKDWKCFDDREELELTYGDPGNKRYKVKMINSRLNTCSNLVP